MTIDQDKLGELLGSFVTDLGAAIAAGNVVVGHRLGLYRGLAGGPATAEELAAAHRHRPPVCSGVAARAGRRRVRELRPRPRSGSR